MAVGSAKKLRLLMWKNFLLQWRHKVQTVVEIFAPVLCASLIVLVRSLVDPVMVDTVTFDSFNPITLRYSEVVLPSFGNPPISLAYSPASPLAESVARNALRRVITTNIPLLDQFNITSGLPVDDLAPIIDMFFTVIPFENSTQLEMLYMNETNLNKVIAAVQFSDDLAGKTTWPDDVSYMLRFPTRKRVFSTSWRTSLLFPRNPTPGPRFSNESGGNDPGYTPEMFLAFQHAISLELIIAKSNNPDAVESMNVAMQRFPHPPYLYDDILQVLEAFVSLFLMLSFTYTAVNIVRAVTTEKEKQLKESMKIMGLRTWLHWTAWFLKQFIFMLLSVVMILILLKVEWYTTEDGLSGYSVFTHTDWSILLVFLVLYIISSICFCFMLSVFFDKASTAGLVTAVLWFLSYAPYFFLQMDSDNLALGVSLLACLSFNTAMGFGFQQIVNAEGQTTGMQWSMLFSSRTGETTFVFGHTLIMLIVNPIVYILIMLYVEKAFPGAYGVPVPWYFPFTKEFWGFSSKQVVYVDQNETDSWEGIVYDKEPVGLNAGVSIVNLTKIYNSSQRAVDRLNLQMYEDQITVLLGHNGAGKTTTLSMLTGMIPPTLGTATISGNDIVNNTQQARESLGLCPQHSILFAELTVEEHIRFYGQLKGITNAEIKQEIDHYVNLLELSHKRHFQACQLSGGQQRRLCVGVAMCGNSKVVLLDEPTSGMDPAARRALWDLLQREKKGRTILLTTHFMDEADILGDRIAIMSGGRLQCVGSPFFLKKQYGLGYTLTIVKETHCNVDACTALLDKYLPGTEVYTNIGSELSYQLPNEGSSHFEQMLGDIETQQRGLGIQSFGLTMTALEEVFMKVGADLHMSKKQSWDNLTPNGSNDSMELVVGSTSTDSIYNTGYRKATGWRLTQNHIIAMILKKALTSIRARLQLILQIIIPVIILIVSILVNMYIASMTEVVVNREFNLNDYQRTSTLFSSRLHETDVEWPIQNAYRRYFEEIGNPAIVLDDTGMEAVDEFYLRKGTISMSRLRFENLVGVSFDPNQMTAWFSNFAFHDITTSLAILHLAMLRSLVPNANMTISNHPLPVPPDSEITFESTEGMNAIRIAFNIGSAMAIVSSFYIMFYINERTSRAKLLQKVSGLQPLVMWLCALIYDMLVYLVICILLIITLLAFGVEGYSRGPEVGYTLLILILFGLAMLTLHYLTIYAFDTATSGFVRMYFISLFLGCMAFLIVEVLNIPALGRQDVGQALDEVLIFYPHYALTQALRNMNFISLNIANCHTICEVLSQQSMVCDKAVLCATNVTSCCIDENVYFDWRTPGISRYITYLAFTSVAFFIILMVIEYRLIDKIFYSGSKPPLPLDLSQEDSDVVSEKILVDKIGMADLESYNVVCKNLSKFYNKHLAVNQTSFAIKGAECFGLLGINGAGKTTTFKMLTGDLSISYGDAWIKGYSIKNEIKKVHREIGYCPQFDALFNELTGRETLKIYGLLRGIPNDTGKYISEKLADKLGFTKHLDKKVGAYSGGNKRKLSTAIALLGDAPVIYLDEPTTGMDPAAKRQLWEVVLLEVRNGRSVILTSHSMEECEALCSRLAIMVDGRFRCLGSPQHLKNKFSQGCTLTLKVSQVEVENATNVSSDWILNSALQPINNFIKQNYPNAQLVEYYQSLLTYYLPNSDLSWSSLFGTMERAKQTFNIEDYSISQTTLEQVFLRFTKETPIVTTEL